MWESQNWAMFGLIRNLVWFPLALLENFLYASIHNWSTLKMHWLNKKSLTERKRTWSQWRVRCVWWNGNWKLFARGHWQHTRWHLGRKSAPKVRWRQCVRGFFEKTTVSLLEPPTPVTLRVLLLMTCSRCWNVTIGSLSTAFLHAPMTEGTLMRQPQASSIQLKTACGCWNEPWKGQEPALWQAHFAQVWINLDFTGVLSQLHRALCIFRRWFLGLWNTPRNPKVHW